MGGSNTTTQTNKSGPWGPTQDDLRKILNQGKKLFNQDKGFHPYPGQTWVDFAPETEQALGSITSMAGQPNPFYGGAQNFTQGLIGGDYNLDKSGFQGMLGQGADAIRLNAGGIASGANGINTEGDFRSLYGSVDPEFEKVVGQTADTLGDQISRQFGGASFGSAAHTGTIADQVGDVVSRMRSANFQQNLANKQNILGNITGLQGQNLANRLAASGMLSGEQMGNLGLERGIRGDIANLEGQDIQNRLAGLGMADQVYQSQYLPAQMLAGVGAAREAKAGEKLQAEMDKFNIQDMNDWDRLMQYFGIATGTGAQGNRTTTSVTQPSNPLASILGGGLLASQMFDPRRFV
jgi:hypothetical protein